MKRYVWAKRTCWTCWGSGQLLGANGEIKRCFRCGGDGTVDE